MLQRTRFIFSRPCRRALGSSSFFEVVGCICLKPGMCLCPFKAHAAGSKLDTPGPSEPGPIPSGVQWICTLPVYWLHLALGLEHSALWSPAACLEFICLCFISNNMLKKSHDIVIVAVHVTATWYLMVKAEGKPWSLHSARTESQLWH